jgi:hypothetical protein
MSKMASLGFLQQGVDDKLVMMDSRRMEAISCTVAVSMAGLIRISPSVYTLEMDS